MTVKADEISLTHTGEPPLASNKGPSSVVADDLQRPLEATDKPVAGVETSSAG